MIKKTLVTHVPHVFANLYMRIQPFSNLYLKDYVFKKTLRFLCYFSRQANKFRACDWKFRLNIMGLLTSSQEKSLYSIGLEKQRLAPKHAVVKFLKNNPIQYKNKRL